MTPTSNLKPGVSTRGWIYSAVASTGSRVLGILTGTLVARVLLPEGRGQLAAIVFWPQLLTRFGTLSIPEAVVYRTARNEPRHPNPVVSASVLALLIVLVGLAIGWLLIPVLLSGETERVQQLSRQFLTILYPANLLVLILAAADQGTLRFRRFNLLRFLPQAVYLVALVLLWCYGQLRAETAALAMLCGVLVTLILRVSISRDWLQSHPLLSEMKQLAKISLQFHGSTILLIATTFMDRALVMVYSDHSAIGLYFVASTYAVAGIGVISDSFTVVLFPRLAGSISKADRRDTLTRAFRYTSFLGVSGAAALAAISPWVIPALFGEAFSPAVSVCIVLLMAQVPGAIRQVVLGALRGFGLWKSRMVGEALCMVTFATAAIPLQHAFGLEGIASALLLGNVVSLIFCIAYLRHSIGTPLSSLWGLNTITAKELWSMVRALSAR